MKLQLPELQRLLKMKHPDNITGLQADWFYSMSTLVGLCNAEVSHFTSYNMVSSKFLFDNHLHTIIALRSYS